MAAIDFSKFVVKPKIFLSKSGRECYLSGINCTSGVWKASIRYVDNGEMTEVKYDLIEKYL